jgi:PAS domain S-box-containing protein
VSTGNSEESESKTMDADVVTNLDEERYKALFEALPVSLQIVDEEGKIVAVNPCHLRGPGRGILTQEDYLGQTIWARPSIVASGLAEDYRKVLEGIGFEKNEVLFPALSGGGSGYCNVRGVPLKKGSKVIGAIYITDDVTKLAEAKDEIIELHETKEEITKSLSEKEVLLKEVHHRVKNNLQIICSLIHLNVGRGREDASIDSILSDIESRVRTMSIVHEMLYQTNDLSYIDCSSYFQLLIDSLVEAYHMDRARIQIAISVENIKLELGKAISCGLLINELVVNAVKHAFPDNRAGIIRITLANETDQIKVLTVEDDGIGARNSTLQVKKGGRIGLSLVTALAAQLNGRYEIDGTNGVLVRIFFPE